MNFIMNFIIHFFNLLIYVTIEFTTILARKQSPTAELL